MTPQVLKFFSTICSSWLSFIHSSHSICKCLATELLAMDTCCIGQTVCTNAQIHLHEVWEELNVGVLSSWKLQSQWLASLGKAHIKNRERHRVNEVLAHVGFYPIHHLRMLASENQRIKGFFGGSRLWSCSVTLRISRPVTTDIA